MRDVNRLTYVKACVTLRYLYTCTHILTYLLIYLLTFLLHTITIGIVSVWYSTTAMYTVSPSVG